MIKRSQLPYSNEREIYEMFLSNVFLVVFLYWFKMKLALTPLAFRLYSVFVLCLYAQYYKRIKSKVNLLLIGITDHSWHMKQVLIFSLEEWVENWSFYHKYK